MFTEPVAAFFTDWAQDATWTVGTSSSTVSVIFDNDYTDPLGQFEATGPAATVRLDQMATVAQGQSLTIGTDAYSIVEVKPDTVGVTAVLRLRR